MSDDQVGCEWVSASSGTGLPGLSQTNAVKLLCVCVCVCPGTYTYWTNYSNWITKVVNELLYVQNTLHLLSY